MGEAEAILQVSGLTAARGGAVVLRDLAMTVHRGDILGLLGPNGAGKSTTVDAICGFVPKRGGRVIFDGGDISRMPAHRVARLGLVQVSQNRDLFGAMSVADNLELGLRLANGSGSSGLDEVRRLFPKLSALWSQKASSLSGGEQQMVALARALAGRPKLLMLDEPSSGLAPKIVQEIGEFLRSLVTTGLTIVLVEQNVSIALGLCTRYVVLRAGRKVFDGDRAGLGADPRRFLAQMYIH